MNATWTLNLYPRAWRQRYEPEFRVALATRSATFLDIVDLTVGAADAHLRPDPTLEQVGRPAAVHSGPSAVAGPPSLFWKVLLGAHITLFAFVNLLLAGINLMTGAETLWFPYVLWGWAIALGLHAGLTFRGRAFLLAAALVTMATSVGLIGIDLANGGLSWAIWPVWALLSLLAVYALYATKRIDGFAAHFLLTILLGSELAVAAFLINDGSELLFALGYWLIGLLVHALYRFGRPSLLTLHVVLFIGVNSLIVIQNTLTDDKNWFIYPLAAWSVILAAHMIVHLQARHIGTRTWEPAMLAHLTSANGATGRKQTLLRVRRKSFLFHLSLFTVGLCMFGVLGLLGPASGRWVVWPLSIWLVLIITHLGALAMPTRPLLGVNLFGTIAVTGWLVILDMATPGGPWWFWPIAGWLTVLVMQIGIVLIPRHPFLGMWLGGGLVVSLGLVAIDYTTRGGPWWFWPVSAWLMVSVIAIPFFIDLLGIVAIDERRRQGT